MPERPARKTPQVNHARVLRTERLSPQMTRVVLGGESLAGLPIGECTDHYIKLLFPVEGVSYPEPFDMADIRRDMPREQWPRIRTYTVRDWDAEARELTVDFVVHGDAGLAGPWARRAQVGEEIRFLGPGGGYAPSAEADWHLLAGDESALPAIAASLSRIPAGVAAKVFLEVADPEERQQLSAPEGVEITWLFREGRQYGSALVEAVEKIDFPSGEVQAFVHGEAGMVKQLRRHLRLERGVTREQLSISGYWRLGKDEDGWQSSKKEWNAAVEAEQEAPVSA